MLSTKCFSSQPSLYQDLFSSFVFPEWFTQASCCLATEWLWRENDTGSGINVLVGAIMCHLDFPSVMRKLLKIHLQTPQLCQSAKGHHGKRALSPRLTASSDCVGAGIRGFRTQLSSKGLFQLHARGFCWTTSSSAAWPVRVVVGPKSSP